MSAVFGACVFDRTIPASAKNHPKIHVLAHVCHLKFVLCDSKLCRNLSLLGKDAISRDHATAKQVAESRLSAFTPDAPLYISK